MNLDELWGLSQWFQKAIVKPNIQNLYSNLTSVVRQNIQPNQPRAALESQKTALLDALRQIDLSELTRDQFTFLSKVGITEFLGKSGAEKVEGILYEGGIDIVTAAQRLQDITTKFNRAVERFSHITQGLNEVVTPSAEPTLQAEEVLLRVTFTSKASISNVVDLKHWSDKWHKIAHGIAMAHNKAPETIRVVGAARGSLILELATSAAIAQTTSTIILSALEVSKRYVDLLQGVAKLKAMHLRNQKIMSELKKEAEEGRDEAVTKISSEITKMLGLKTDQEGDKVRALGSAIKTLVNFLTEGGEVDCVVPQNSDAVDDDVKTMRAKLRQDFETIRSLEEDLRRIEYKPDDDGDGDAEGEDAE